MQRQLARQILLTFYCSPSNMQAGTSCHFFQTSDAQVHINLYVYVFTCVWESNDVLELVLLATATFFPSVLGGHIISSPVCHQSPESSPYVACTGHGILLLLRQFGPLLLQHLLLRPLLAQSSVKLLPRFCGLQTC